MHSAKVALADDGERLRHKGKDPGGRVKGSQVPAALPRDVVVLQYSQQAVMPLMRRQLQCHAPVSFHSGDSKSRHIY